jgi:hypothetical protein
MPDPPGSPASIDRYDLKLVGVEIGRVPSFEGGAAFADVVSETSGPAFYAHKHVGLVKYEDLTLHVGLDLAAPLYDWIAASWQESPPTKSGSIVRFDFNFNAIDERDFANALLTQVAIPALDAVSKDPCRLGLKLSPEFTSHKKASGRVSGTPPGGKAWIASHFRLAIDGLDTTKVSRIEAFTVRRPVIIERSGGGPAQRIPGKLDVPDLEILVSEAASQSWSDWFDDFVIAGNNDETHEKGGTLTFLAPDLQEELGRITFFNLGIHRFSPEPDDPSDDTIRRVRATLYCERVAFHVGPSA